jgi:hypothetical protein
LQRAVVRGLIHVRITLVRHQYSSGRELAVPRPTALRRGRATSFA